MGTLVCLTPQDSTPDYADTDTWRFATGTKRFFEVNKMSLPEGYEKEQ